MLEIFPSELKKKKRFLLGGTSSKPEASSYMTAVNTELKVLENDKTRPLALCGNVGPFIYSYLMKLLFINMF